MKITKTRLRQIIKEEVSTILESNPFDLGPLPTRKPGLKKKKPESGFPKVHQKLLQRKARMLTDQGVTGRYKATAEEVGGEVTVTADSSTDIPAQHERSLNSSFVSDMEAFLTSGDDLASQDTKWTVMFSLG